MSFLIRNYKKEDLDFLYQICLLTGKSGKDASGLFNDKKLLGHFYAAPYAVLEPEVCFVVTNKEKPCGYIIGTKNSQKFYDRCEAEWFPELRKQYPLPNEDDDSPDAKIIKRIHEGHTVKPELKNYPAHLHIDLLPETQGQGMGRKIMEVFINNLKKLNVPAVHLEVGKANPNAIMFYKKMGFHIIHEYEYSIAFGVKF